MVALHSNGVLQLFDWRNQINLDPPYQRLSVWDRRKRQTFVDSVINGFDIPKLYFHDVSSTASSPSPYRFAVIDGKQRLQALWDFMSNQIPLADDFVFFDDLELDARGKTYDELMIRYPRLRARFDDFEVPITLVQTDDENFIEDLFARLNIQVALSAPERRNALGGPVPYMIRKLGVSPFFKDYVRIRKDRLQHFDLAAKFLYLTYVDSVASTKRETLDNFVRAFRRFRDEGGEEASEERLNALQAATELIMSSMEKFFIERDSLLSSSGRVALYFHLFRKYQRLRLPVPLTREILEEFNDAVASARKKSQRMAQGSREQLTDDEQILVRFDREKQTPNDVGAIERQFSDMRKYFSRKFHITLPESLEPRGT